MELLEEKYGIEAQNKALVQVRAYEIYNSRENNDFRKRIQVASVNTKEYETKQVRYIEENDRE